MNKIATFCIATFLCLLLDTSISCASLTKEQSDGVADFATTFIEKGNERRDEKGYPLLVYALSNNGNTCIEIRRSGYNSELYHVVNNSYHMKNGSYLDLGYKWCMDCGDFIAFVYHTTLGLDLMLHSNEDPWHIKDMYADAKKYDNSQYFEFVYKDVPISSIDENKLQKGDIILRIGSKENHGLIYVGEGMQSAHASRNGIKYYKDPLILGFEIVQLNRFYKTSTIVSIVRVKDGVVPEGQKVNSRIVWPDTLEEEYLLGNDEVLEFNEFSEYIKYEDLDLELLDFIDDANYTKIDNFETDGTKDNLLYWVSEEIKRFLMKLNEIKGEAIEPV